MRRAIKRSLLNVARRAGYFRLLARSAWRGERLLILTWHGISLADEHEWDPYLFITPELLDQRLTAIRENGYQILPLAEALQRLAAGTLPPASVALTFDDGYYNFYRHAVPVLKKHNAPATVYVTTYYVDNPWPVPGLAASYLLWKQRGRGPVAIRSLPGIGTADLSNEVNRQSLFDAFATRAESTRMGGRRKHAFVGALADDLGVDFEGFCRQRILSLMSPDEIAEIASSELITVGLHTHNHRVPLDEAQFSYEVLHNRNRLAAITGQQATHFCYPSGKWSPAMLPWLERTGVVSATTCDHGLATRSSPLLSLPRFLDHTLLVDSEFDAWLCGLAARLPGIYKTTAGGDAVLPWNELPEGAEDFVPDHKSSVDRRQSTIEL